MMAPTLNFDGFASDPARAKTDGGDQKTVLIVDDEVNVLEVYTAFLEEEFTVQTATDGRTALDMIDSQLDAVLLDRRMPGLSGEELLERIREKGYAVPVGMITAVEPGLDIAEMAFDEYIMKPVDFDRLKRITNRLVKRGDFDAKSRELFRIARKSALLKSSPAVDHDDSPEYKELIDRFDELRADLDQTLEEFTADDPEMGFRDLIPKTESE